MSDGLQDFLNRSSADREQAEAATGFLADLVSLYYHALVKRGLPPEIAGELSRDYQLALTVRQ